MSAILSNFAERADKRIIALALGAIFWSLSATGGLAQDNETSHQTEGLLLLQQSQSGTAAQPPNGQNSQNTTAPNQTSGNVGTPNQTGGLQIGNQPYGIQGQDVLGRPRINSQLGAADNSERQKPAEPGEFEKYVEQAVGTPVPRFGASLLLPEARDFSLPSTASVPVDYIVNPGDQFTLSSTGALETTYQVEVDREGNIFVPRVGSIHVAGVRYGDLATYVTSQLGRQYRDFKVSVTISRLHGIRVFVTGYAAHPGAYSVSSLSTLFDALLMSGGPAAGGSFRRIQLLRGGKPVTSFDLYDLLLRGDRSKDAVVQNQDVIYVPPVGPQVAITGSVNNEAIYEAAPDEDLSALLHDAGGLGELADGSRVILSQLSDLDGKLWVQIDLEQSLRNKVHGGDILRILSYADYSRPIEQQGMLVKIEGEVSRPGNYYLEPGSTVAELMQKVGPLTPRAYIYGTEFKRASVKAQQQKSFDEAIAQMEMAISASPLTSSSVKATDVSAAREVVSLLKKRKPDGRMILDIAPKSAQLPLDLVLENNDTIYIPPKPVTVGVYGAVYRPGSIQMRNGMEISDYVDLAGGPTEFAGRSSLIVVRASGEVLTADNGAMSEKALPGDMIFMPSRLHPSTLLEHIKDFTTILFQAGVTIAAVIGVTK